MWRYYFSEITKLVIHKLVLVTIGFLVVTWRSGILKILLLIDLSQVFMIV